MKRWWSPKKNTACSAVANYSVLEEIGLLPHALSTPRPEVSPIFLLALDPNTASISSVSISWLVDQFTPFLVFLELRVPLDCKAAPRLVY